MTSIGFIPATALGVVLLLVGALRFRKRRNRSTRVPLSVEEIKIREALRVRLGACEELTDETRTRLEKNLRWLEARAASPTASR